MRRFALGLFAVWTAALALAPGVATGQQQQTFSTVTTAGKAPAPIGTPANATVSGLYFNYYPPYGPLHPSPPPCRHCRSPIGAYPGHGQPLPAPKVAPPHR
jgi:hypothetical protein